MDQRQVYRTERGADSDRGIVSSCQKKGPNITAPSVVLISA